MKYTLVLILNLAAAWMVWSGSVSVENPFVMLLGVLSILFSMFVCLRMEIADSESVPLHFSWRIIPYACYLIKEIVIENFAVAKIVLAPRLQLQRNMLVVHAKHKTETGNVVLANSITLTPGTVSVSMSGHDIKVHALFFEGAEESLSGEMVRQVNKLEGHA
jgi:multicomponent Na+:H+ antiporter subunit E